MIKIVKGGYNSQDWSIVTEKNSVTGSMVEVCKVALGIGIQMDELCYALDAVEENKHDVMEFGINKLFIRSE
jgi:hypothetical protein